MLKRLLLLAALAPAAFAADMHISAPSSILVNAGYYVEASSSEVYVVSVLKNGNYFAGGYWSGGDWTSDSSPQNVHYEAVGEDGYDETYTDVYNTAPDSSSTSLGGVTSISLGQSVTVTGTLHDPDGNLQYHDLFIWPPGGSVWLDRGNNHSGWSSDSGTPGAPSDPTSSTISGIFTPPSLGTWSFNANGHDGDNWGPGETKYLSVVDGTAPSIPGGFVLNATNNTTGHSFTLNWSAFSDNIGVTAYEVMKDSTSLGTTSSLSMDVTGLTDTVAYVMKVRARDAAGNWSSWSSTCTVTTPTTTPTPPTSVWATSRTTTSFTLNWSGATDNIGITGYEVQLQLGNNTPVTTSVDASPVGFTGLTANTTYKMKVRAKDNVTPANWSSWSTEVNVTTYAGFADADSDGISNGAEALLGLDQNTTNSDSSNTTVLNVHLPIP